MKFLSYFLLHWKIFCRIWTYIKKLFLVNKLFEWDNLIILGISKCQRSLFTVSTLWLIFHVPRGICNCRLYRKSGPSMIIILRSRLHRTISRRHSVTRVTSNRCIQGKIWCIARQKWIMPRISREYMNFLSFNNFWDTF